MDKYKSIIISLPESQIKTFSYIADAEGKTLSAWLLEVAEARAKEVLVLAHG